MGSKQSRAKPATSSTPPVITEVRLLRISGNVFHLELLARFGRQMLYSKRWEFELDPTGDLPPEVACELWEAVQRPLNVLSRHNQPGLF